MVADMFDAQKAWRAETILYCEAAMTSISPWHEPLVPTAKSCQRCDANRATASRSNRRNSDHDQVHLPSSPAETITGVGTTIWDHEALTEPRGV